MGQIKYTIYKLIDPTDNKIRYIGLTFNSLKERLKSHRNEKGKSHKCYWIKKLKLNGMEPIIESIEENISSYEVACEREIYFMDYFRSIGCDLTNSATGGNKNKKMSIKTREKMSKSRIERCKTHKIVLSESTKKILSEKSKLRFQDPNEREKLRISNKRYEDSKTDEQKLQDILIQNSKKVFQYDLDMNLIGEYPSLNYASKMSGCASSNIGKCCKHKVRTVGGFIWRFEGDNRGMRNHRNAKSIIQYDMDMNFIKEYSSVKNAAESIGSSPSVISACCKGKYKSSGGFIWKYKLTS